MKHAARIFLLLSATLLLAYYLPIAWHMLTVTRERGPLVQYSDIAGDFLLMRYDINPTTCDATITYSDTSGRIYERDAYEKLLPHLYYMQLEKDGTMPKEINGVKITTAALRREMFSYRIRPDALDAPAVALHTVFETGNGRARLEMPADYMRIRNDGRIEFLDSKTNSILPEKSTLFTEAFASMKFAFPVSALGSNPNPRKPYDEGIFLADADGRTFLLRQALGAPILVRLETISADPAAWRALRPKHIIVDELETREVRALIVDADGQLWLATGKNYELHKLPVATYDVGSTSFTLRGSLLNRVLLVQGEQKLEAVALDRNYKILKRYEEKLTTRDELAQGKIGSILFPFSWWLSDDSSGYFGFYGKTGAALSLALNAFLIVAYIIWLRIRRRKIGINNLPECIIIAGGGVCGLLPALFVPRAE